jgi:hypothetical protein
VHLESDWQSPDFTFTLVKNSSSGGGSGGSSVGSVGSSSSSSSSGSGSSSSNTKNGISPPTLVYKGVTLLAETPNVSTTTVAIAYQPLPATVTLTSTGITVLRNLLVGHSSLEPQFNFSDGSLPNGSLHNGSLPNGSLPNGYFPDESLANGHLAKTAARASVDPADAMCQAAEEELAAFRYSP